MEKFYILNQFIDMLIFILIMLLLRLSKEVLDTLGIVFEMILSAGNWKQVLVKSIQCL